MTTYYRDKRVRVTSDLFEVGDQAYRLPELARVWHRSGARSWGTVAGRSALGMAIVGPIVAAAIGIVIALRLDADPGTTVALVGGACLVGLLAGPLADLLLEYLDRSYARGSRTHEIWADWRGRSVLLLHTRDALRFGQIYRALQRAIENPRPARSGAARQGGAARPHTGGGHR